MEYTRQSQKRSDSVTNKKVVATKCSRFMLTCRLPSVSYHEIEEEEPSPKGLDAQGDIIRQQAVRKIAF